MSCSRRFLVLNSQKQALVRARPDAPRLIAIVAATVVEYCQIQRHYIALLYTLPSSCGTNNKFGFQYQRRVRIGFQQ